jgi:hypothetical protein
MWGRILLALVIIGVILTILNSIFNKSPPTTGGTPSTTGGTPSTTGGTPSTTGGTPPTTGGTPSTTGGTPPTTGGTPPTTGVWRNGALGAITSKRKLGELFHGTYPGSLSKCVERAKERNFKYIDANDQGGKPSCRFYNDDGINDMSAIHDGDVMDIAGTWKTRSHYIV